MIFCRRARDYVLRELDRELSLDAALELESHLATCANCATFARRAQAVDEALVALAEPPVEHLDIERNVAAISARLREQPRPARRVPWPVLVAAAVIAVLVGVAAWLMRERASISHSSEGIAGESERVEPTTLDVSEDTLDDRPASQEQDFAIHTSTEEFDGAPDLHDEPATVDEDARIDPSRRDAALELMRSCLRDAQPLLATRASRGEALAFAKRVDESAKEHRLTQWPLTRLAESLFDDPEFGAAAMCYAALRGDRLSDLELERRAVNDRDALMARFDDADVSSAAVAAACVDPRFQNDALTRLREFAPADILHVLSSALSKRGPAESDRQPVLEMFVEFGPAAVAPLVRLDRAGAIDRRKLTEMLGQIEGSGELVAQLAVDARDGLAYWVDLCAELEVPQAVPWFERLLGEPRSRDLAIGGLARLASAEAFDVLLSNSLRGFVDTKVLEGALAELASRRPDVLRNTAELTLARAEPASSSRLLDLLIADANPRCVSALLAFTALPNLPAEERELALDAIGEFGDERHLAELTTLFRTFTLRERRLAASCTLAIEAIGGRASLEVLLAGAPRRHLERVLEIFDRPTSASVSRVQLARALEPLLDPRSALSLGGNL